MPLPKPEAPGSRPTLSAIPMRIHLQTLGCRLNEAELETWARDFHGLGHQITAETEQADLLVVNTCAVTEEAVRKSRKLLRRAQRENPAAKLVVSGCYASLEGKQRSAELGVDLIVDNWDKDRLAEIVCREFGPDTMPASATEPDARPLLARGRQRAFIKVQDGCRYRCTYCIVTLARGEERSRPIAEIVHEVATLHVQGIQEVVLTGVHLGGYSGDQGADLKGLVQAILADTDLPRLRLGSVEPWDLPGDFWNLFDDPRLMPHLHLPLQSGSDAVLRRMARRCRSADFERLIHQARAQVPNFNATTDIIVGFPGETETDWEATLELVERLEFGHLHIFAFSPRTGTKAAKLADPVPRAVQRTRCEALQALGQKMKRRALESQLGRVLPVLVEGAGRGWAGYTPNFLRVQIEPETEAALENRIVPVRLHGLVRSGEALSGRPVIGEDDHRRAVDVARCSSSRSLTR